MGAQPATIKSSINSEHMFPAAWIAWLLSLLLIDMAVETFLSRSPVRWWVAGIVMLYFAATAGTWRGLPSVWQRVGWRTRASASFVLLLAIVALTSWLPGGLTEGVRLFGQPTSRVFSLLTIATIVLAGVSLMRLPWLPRWAKLVVAAVAAYGLAGFVKGIISGTEYPDLLHGESLWMRLPSWMQGAFVGALIVVPAGLLTRAASMFRAAPAASRSWDLRQVIALAMSALMAISAVTSTGAYGPQPSAAEIVQPLAKSYQDLQQTLAGPKTPLTPQQVADRLDKLFPTVDQAEKRIPRDTFDPQPIIDKVGKDPKKLFEWVRDNTYFVPYKGLLRGEKGVLMDRLGNSLDRALLLFALLKYVDEPARLAHGTLTDAQARNVLANVRPFPSFKERTGENVSDLTVHDVINSYAQQEKVDAAKIRKTLDTIAAQQQRLKELVQRRVAAQTAMIGRMVGIPSNDVIEGEPDQVRAVTDHWWVQSQIAGNWVDLDSTLPQFAPGQALTSAQTTVIPITYTDLEPDLVHTVQIQVVIEIWKDGAIQEVPVLTQQIVPASIIGEEVFLYQIPVHWSPPPSGSLPGEQLKRAVLEQTEWLPILKVGDQQTLKYSFNDRGELADASLPEFAHAQEEGVQALAGGINDMLHHQQPSNQVSPASRPQVTAEWVDYEIRTPGQSPRKVRRQLFDLMGSFMRLNHTVAEWHITPASTSERAAAAISQTEILNMVCSLSPQFIRELSLQALLAVQRAIRSAYPATSPSVLPSEPSAKPLPGALYDFALAQQQWESDNTKSYFKSVSVLSFHRVLHIDDTGDLKGIEGFDLVYDDVGSAVIQPKQRFIAHIQRGVLNSNLEAILLPSCKLVPISPSCINVENTSELASHVGQDKRHWILMKPNRRSGLRAGFLPRDIEAHLKLSLSQGSELLIPSIPSSAESRTATLIAWWEIDPLTGRTEGIGSRGWGQSATESKIIIGVETTLVCVLTKAFYYPGQSVPGEGFNKTPISDTFFCALLGAAGGLGAPPGFFLMKSPLLFTVYVLLVGVAAGGTSRQH